MSSTTPEGHRLIRKFSESYEQENPGSDLGQSLGHKARYDDWRSLFEETDQDVENEEKMLHLACQRTAKAWEELEKRLPPEQKVQSTRFPSQLRDVTTAAGLLQKQWESKRETGLGKASSRINKFLQSMDQYSELLRILPKEDKYISIFSGSISIIITAAVSHESTAEGFTKGLEEIDNEVSHCKYRMRILNNNVRMRYIVIQIFAQIFGFLAEMIYWFTSKRHRLAASLKKDFYAEHVEAWVISIKEKSTALWKECGIEHQRISQETNHISRNIRQQVGEVSDRLQHVLTVGDFENLMIQAQRNIDQNFEQKVHKVAQLLLGQQAQQVLVDVLGRNQEVQSSINRKTIQEASSDLPSDTMPDRPLKSFSRSELLSRTNAHVLESFSNTKEVSAILERSQHLTVDPRIMGRLQRWLSEAGTAALWVYGPAESGFPTSMSYIAANVVQVALKTKTPILIHFCQARPTPEAWAGSSSSDGTRLYRLLDMLHCLINQLLPLLPDIFETEYDWSSVDFASQTLTSGGIPAAFSIFKELWRLVPTSFFCVIDGLQWIASENDNDADQWVRQMLETIRPAREDNLPSPIRKVLLTTPGISGLLASGLPSDDKFNAMNCIPRKGDKPRPGLRPMNSLR